MAEANQNSTERCFKDAVCIDAGRVYDSCCDRDCLEDIQVYLAPCDQETIENAVSVRVKNAAINSVYINVEPETFNKGHYSVNMTFYFNVTADVIPSIGATPVSVTGVSFFEKKVILYGSEGSAKIYSSEYIFDDNDEQLPVTTNLPRAIVQTVDPIVLSSQLSRQHCCCPRIPKGVMLRAGMQECCCSESKLSLEVTLGLFTVVQLIRNVQMMVPVYDFCVPQKECVNTKDSPCEQFSKIKFPTGEFFPPSATFDFEGGNYTSCEG